MPSRLVRVVVVALIGLVWVVPAGADCFLNSIARDIKRRQCWPKPFNGADREAVYAPFNVMVANGWQRQNTLGDYHFEDGGQLTQAGRLKVQWILTEAPDYRREVYVHRGQSPEETAARLGAVQQLAGQLLPPGHVAPVFTTDIPAPGTPADRVDAIGRKFQASMPNPRLPAETQSGGSGTGAK